MYRALCQAQCLVSQWLLCAVYVWCLLHPLCDLTESHKGLLLETGLASSQEPRPPAWLPTEHSRACLLPPPALSLVSAGQMVSRASGGASGVASGPGKLSPSTRVDRPSPSPPCSGGAVGGTPELQVPFWGAAGSGSLGGSGGVSWGKPEKPRALLLPCVPPAV